MFLTKHMSTNGKMMSLGIGYQVKIGLVDKVLNSHKLRWL